MHELRGESRERAPAGCHRSDRPRGAIRERVRPKGGNQPCLHRGALAAARRPEHSDKPRGAECLAKPTRVVLSAEEQLGMPLIEGLQAPVGASPALEEWWLRDARD